MILFYAAVLCLAAVSCQKENIIVAEEGEIHFNFTINAPGAQDTKAAKKGWVSGDKINIWFDGNGEDQTVPDLIITFDGTNWIPGALRSGVQAGLLDSGKLTAVYEGYNDVSSAHYSYDWFGGNEWFRPYGISNTFTENYSSYASPLVVYAQKIDYSYDDGTVSATLSGWRFRTSFKVLVTGLDVSAENCILQVIDEDNNYSDAPGPWLIRPVDGSYTTVGTGSSNYHGYACGVQEADGIAFYYNSFVTTDKKVTFRLSTDLGATEKSYTTPAAKTIDTSDGDKCIGVVVDYSKFDYKMAAAATARDRGKLICAAGHIHTYNTDAACTADRVAMIIYVGTNGEAAPYNHGLALALADEGGDSKMNWSTAMSTCPGKNTSSPVTDATWLLASQDQWNLMMGEDGAGSYADLRDGFSVVGGTNMLEDRYWSSTDYSNDYNDFGRSFDFSSGEWGLSAQNNSWWARSALAF